MFVTLWSIRGSALGSEPIKSELVAKGRSLWQDGLRRLRRRRLAVVCFVVVVIYFGLAHLLHVEEMRMISARVRRLLR